MACILSKYMPSLDFLEENPTRKLIPRVHATGFPGGEVTRREVQVDVIKLIASSQETFPSSNTSLAELSLLLGALDAPKWRMSRRSSIFCDGHTWVSIRTL